MGAALYSRQRDVYLRHLLGSPFVGPADEYPDIYKKFAQLLDANQSKVDAAPFQLVADAFMLAARFQVDAFDFGLPPSK